MSAQQFRLSYRGAFLMASALAVSAIAGPALAQTPLPTIKYFAVGPDQTLTYPSNLQTLPDEHTTFIPPFRRDFPPPAPGEDNFLVFASSNIAGGTGGTVVLQTSDLTNFDFAYTRGFDAQVMTPPVKFTLCDPAYNIEFDENYSAPGTVVQDPTRPPGNMMMFYEAENHCPGGVWQQPYYATIGFARSSDGGRTWPAPIDAEFGGKDRYPVLKLAAPEPASEPAPAAMGNAIPSAFIDKDNKVYITYEAHEGPGVPSDALIRIARAKLDGEDDEFGDDDHGGDNDHAGDQDGDDHHRVHFKKWFNGAFSEPGIGGNDTGVLPARGCPGFQTMAEISYNDDLGQYLMVYVCASIPDGIGAWYYSTATSLEKQDWAAPRMVLNSQFPLTSPCPGLTSGGQFDGWYPSLVSPDAAQSHTKLTGRVFFMNGCDTGLQRSFMSRGFQIVTGP
jgi:hypothetical protein